jgi:hypothetical protein
VLFIIRRNQSLLCYLNFHPTHGELRPGTPTQADIYKPRAGWKDADGLGKESKNKGNLTFKFLARQTYEKEQFKMSSTSG